MKHPRIPRPLIVPRLVMEYSVMSSVYDAINTIRANFLNANLDLKAQGMSDLNMLFQQTTKVHEKAGRTEPARHEIIAAQNVLSRLNAEAEIKRSEFEYVVKILERVLAAVRTSVDPEIWRDVEMTLEIKHELHGATPENWVGGVLSREVRV